MTITYGPPRIFIPICKSPADYLHTAGPVGYVEVEAVETCPILVEPEQKTDSTDGG